jgi:glycosyltransferase involved in cell wall biosynthesis
MLEKTSILDRKLVYPKTKFILRNIYRVILGWHAVVTSILFTGKNIGLRIYYGGARSGHAGGPLVKVRRLKEAFGESRFSYNLLYVLSNAPYIPGYAYKFIKSKNIPVILNQNGVFYKAWYKGDWERENKQMAIPYHLADHVFYQSEFCQRAANKYLGERQGASEILYNAVDTIVYSPSNKKYVEGETPFVFLLTGRIGGHLFYRIESTLRGFSMALNNGLNAKLIIAGGVDNKAYVQACRLMDELKINDHVTFSGPYRQMQAPEIYRKAHAYITTTHQDNCPNAVIEALSTGLPVIYSNTGGVPELVGSEAGIALECAEDWECRQTPETSDICNGMLNVVKNYKQMSALARKRAVDNFDIADWIKRHKEIFSQFLNK